jgi:hypothetical protein
MPHNVEEQTTVRDAIGHAARLLRSERPEEMQEVLIVKASIWTDIAAARATSDLASSVADIADAMRTIGIELGAISIAIGESGEAK